MAWDLQQLKHKKVFGDYLPGTRPIRYRRSDWERTTQGRGRTAALVLAAFLGVPTYHGDNETPVWSFQFDDGGLLVIHYRRGSHAVEISARGEEESKDLQSAFDFLLAEVTNRLLVVSGQAEE